MKNGFLISIITLCIVLPSCSGAPSEIEVKEKLQGNYCLNRHKLELRSDGTYLNQRIYRGALSGTPVFDKCEGTYKIEWDGGQGGWMLKLEKSTKKSSPAANCGGSTQLVWKKSGGYVLQDSLIVLEEMFDGEKVVKNNCD